MTQFESKESNSIVLILQYLWNFIGTILGFLNPFRDHEESTTRIPGPTSWPIFGDAMQLNKCGGSEQFLTYVAQLHAKYGPIFKTKLGPKTFVFVSDPSMYKEIIKKEPRCPSSLKLPSNDVIVKKHHLTRGLFFQNGEAWSKGRALLTQMLLKDTGKFMATVVNGTAPLMTNMIQKWKQDSGKFDNAIIETIEQDCYELALSELMAVTFGPNFNKYLTLANADIQKLAANAIKLNAVTFELNNLPIQIPIALGMTCWKYFESTTLNNINTGRAITDIALDALKNSQNGGSLEEFGLLYRFKSVCNATDEEIRVNCADFTLDILDATPLATLWALYALGRCVEAQDKILKEIYNVCGNTRPIQYEDLESMPYLKAASKESFRLYPVAPLVLRALEEPVVIGGYTVPSDYVLALSTFHSHINPKHFSRPEEFLPERWLGNENKENPQRTESAYYPFGIGKRVCAGKFIVQSILRLFMASVVQNFVIHSEPVSPKLKIMLYPDSPFKISLKPRMQTF